MALCAVRSCQPPVFAGFVLIQNVHIFSVHVRRQKCHFPVDLAVVFQTIIRRKFQVELYHIIFTRQIFQKFRCSFADLVYQRTLVIIVFFAERGSLFDEILGDQIGLITNMFQNDHLLATDLYDLSCRHLSKYYTPLSCCGHLPECRHNYVRLLICQHNFLVIRKNIVPHSFSP